MHFLPRRGGNQTAREGRNMFQQLRAFLEENEAENHLFLGVLASAPEGTRPVTVEKEGRMVAATIFVERNAVVAGDARFVPQLVSAWKLDVPGAVARADLATAWAEEWSRQRGCQARLAVSQRIYRLEQVIEPPPLPGELRLAEDVEQLTEWIEGFDQEALAHERSGREANRAQALRRARARMTYFWVVEGRPVSMAALARPSQNGVCVNLVYTPPELRGRGYASAVTAAVSQKGLDLGYRFCCLYTDLSNPTSNSIYKKLGYKPVCDSAHYQFRYPV